MTVHATVIVRDAARTAPVSPTEYAPRKGLLCSSSMYAIHTIRTHCSDPCNLSLRLFMTFLMLALALASPVMTFLADSGIPK